MGDYIWQPVPMGFRYDIVLPFGADLGEVPFSLSVPPPTSMLKDHWLSINDYWGRSSIPLPDNIRLCRATPAQPVPVEAIRKILVAMAYGTSEDSWQTVNAWLDKQE